MAERGRALKGLMRKGGAFGQKALSFPFLIPAEQGRRSQGAGAGLRRRPRAWRRPGSGGKGRWAHGRSNPLLNSSGGGPWRWRHGGGRRWAWGRRHEARRRPGLGEKGEGSPEGSSAYLGLGCGGVGRGAPRWPVLAAVVAVLRARRSSGGRLAGSWR